MAPLPGQMAAAQSAARRPKASEGPRALGLVQLAPNGKAFLIPVVIMYDGQFYDAGAYKAAPVPMALESGVVYEAERSGVPQGLFTVHGALQGPNNTWKAEGTWLPEGAKPANAPHRAESQPRDLEPEEGPPVLRHGGAEKSKPAEPEPAPSAAPAKTEPASSAAEAKPEPAAAPPPPAPSAAAPPASAPAAEPPPPPDPDAPVLRRGKSTPAAAKIPAPAASAKPGAASPAPTKSKPASPPPQLIPAISDAGGPDPRPYAYSMKPEDEAQLRKKVLAMAADEVRSRAQQLASTMVVEPAEKPAAAARRKPAAPPKPPQPVFEDVQLHAFDLSTSNEPILVLTASARMPEKSDAGTANLQYLLTLVARQDLYGDLHKAFSNVTDTQHLDVIPRMDLVDAVDVDGDGRGELLFRKTSDAGSAYVVYRVIGEQLWALFEGTPGS